MISSTWRELNRRRVGTRDPARARWRNIAISGTTPEPPATRKQRPAERGLPDEVAADRTAQLDPVADDDDVVEERRDLAVVDALDRDLDLAGTLGLGRDRVAPLDAVAVLRGQAKVDVLARAVSGQAGTRSVNERTVGVSSRIAVTVASCQEMGPAMRRMLLVAAVAFFEPLVATIVVAERLPESGLVL